MRRVLAAVLLLLLVAGCSRPPQEAKGRAAAYTNPVYIGTKDGFREAADPGPLKYNGEYYAYMTGDPCFTLKSEDLVSWKLVGPMTAERGNCWAPDVTYKNGKFYAYLSTLLPGTPESSRRVRLYTADKPEGPFTLVGDLTRFYSYDAHFFRDDDGAEYLYWTQECLTLTGVDPCAGNAVVVDRLTDMQTLSGKVTRVAVTQIGEWECRSRCILEAPQVLKRDGRYYLQYSGAAYENPSYGGGSAVSSTPMGPNGPKDESWVKGAQVLQSIEAKVDGPGGASWVKGPTNLEDWTIYHGRGITRETWDRWPRIDPVMWGRDRFWIPGGASYQAQPGPALPAFRDLFNRADAPNLGKDWTASGGQWAVKSGAAQQAAPAGAARALEPRSALHYAFEANLRFLSGQGQAGVVAYFVDEKNQATALIDREKGALVINAVVKGAALAPVSYPLPNDLAYESYHQLLVRKNGKTFSFAVDGRPAATLVLGFDGPGKAGLATEGAAAEFDGVALAEGWEDFFSAGLDSWSALDWTAAQGQWAVKDGVLTQTSDAGEAAALKGSREWGSYAFTASLRPASSRGEVGIYAAYADAKNYVEIVLKAEGSLETRAVLNGKAAEVHAFPIADPVAWHTVRITKNGFTFTFYLDGKRLEDRTVNLGRGQPGLFTRNAAGEFDSVSAVRWD